jgi:beta-mannosidase
MRIHERHVAGWPNLNHYMSQYFKPTKDFETFVYGTMVMQAYAIETAIQALRRNRPYCMGSLYW